MRLRERRVWRPRRQRSSTPPRMSPACRTGKGARPRRHANNTVRRRHSGYGRCDPATIRRAPRSATTSATRPPTGRRQSAAIAERADLVIVVGSQNSSNTLRLVEVARRCGTTAYRVEGIAEIDPTWYDGVGVVGLTSGASAPEELIEPIPRRLAPARCDEDRADCHRGGIHRVQPGGRTQDLKPTYLLPNRAARTGRTRTTRTCSTTATSVPRVGSTEPACPRRTSAASPLQGILAKPT